MKTKAYCSVLIILSFIAVGCSTETEPPVDMGYSYIPLDTGRYYIYDVDSIYKECSTSINLLDTVHYQIKEYYHSIVLDASNNPVLRIERYYRADSTQSWNTMTPDVWFIDTTITRFEKVEENIKFVKMIFPITEGTTWDGNAYNVFAQQDYFYGAPQSSFNNGVSIFDNTVTVYQQLDTNMIEYYYFTETYAKDVGMIYKTKYNVENLQTSTGNCPPWPYWPLDWYQVPKLWRIKKGSLVTYKLIDYGFE